MKPSLPVLLSVNGGYVDTASFLALQGLFTSHVTGNFVTLGAALVLGTSGVTAKLTALPMFCLVVFSTRLVSAAMPARIAPALRLLLGFKVLLLIVAALLALHFGPFHNGDSWQALLTGMTLVAAMGIQNAIHRTHMTNTSPTTIMTGNTVQIMLDLADTLRPLAPEVRRGVIARLQRLSASVFAFALGCAAAAWIFAKRGEWCFIVPPILGLYMLSRRNPLPEAPAVARA